MIERENNFSIIFQAKTGTKGSSKSRTKLPFRHFGERFEKMRDVLLGKKYVLNVVIADSALSKKLNFQYRKKNKPTDILSFPLAKNEGEIFLNLPQCRLKAKKFGRTFENYLDFVFIHGLTHLKGFTHGSRMETEEKKFRKRFGI